MLAFVFTCAEFCAIIWSLAIIVSETSTNNFRKMIFWTSLCFSQKLLQNNIKITAFSLCLCYIPFSRLTQALAYKRKDQDILILVLCYDMLSPFSQRNKGPCACVSMVSKRAGSKTNVLLPFLRKPRNICCESTVKAKCFWKKSETFPQILRARANRETFWETNVSATIFPCLPRPLSNWHSNKSMRNAFFFMSALFREWVSPTHIFS